LVAEFFVLELTNNFEVVTSDQSKIFRLLVVSWFLWATFSFLAEVLVKSKAITLLIFTNQEFLKILL
jgi:hypothetical protein